MQPQSKSIIDLVKEDIDFKNLPKGMQDGFEKKLKEIDSKASLEELAGFLKGSGSGPMVGDLGRIAEKIKKKVTIQLIFN